MAIGKLFKSAEMDISSLIDFYLLLDNIYALIPAFASQQISTTEILNKASLFYEEANFLNGGNWHLGGETEEDACTWLPAAFPFWASMYYILRQMPGLLKLRIDRSLLKFHPWFPVNVWCHFKFKTLALFLRHSMSHWNEQEWWILGDFQQKFWHILLRFWCMIFSMPCYDKQSSLRSWIYLKPHLFFENISVFLANPSQGSH